MYDPRYPAFWSPLDAMKRLRDVRRHALSCARAVAADPSHTGRPGWPDHNMIATHEAALADLNRAIEREEARHAR